jgi:hypothetical protein
LSNVQYETLDVLLQRSLSLSGKAIGNEGWWSIRKVQAISGCGGKRGVSGYEGYIRCIGVGDRFLESNVDIDGYVQVYKSSSSSLLVVYTHTNLLDIPMR